MNHWNDGFAADASLCRMRLGHSCHVPRMRNHWKINSKTKLDHACLNETFRHGFSTLCTCRKSAKCKCNSSNQRTLCSWPRTTDCHDYNCEENAFPVRRSFPLDFEFWGSIWNELHIAIDKVAWDMGLSESDTRSIAPQSCSTHFIQTKFLRSKQPQSQEVRWSFDARCKIYLFLVEKFDN